jgi:hypothetical protein
MTTRKSALLARIAREKSLGDDLKAELKSALDEFQEQWKAQYGQPS